MNLKNLLLVVTGGVLIGIALVWIGKWGNSKNITQPNIVRQDSREEKSEIFQSTPEPTQPPINENSNLEEEINNLAPKNYSEEFNNLRN